MIQRRIVNTGTRKLKNRIVNRNIIIQTLTAQIEDLTLQVTTLQSQVSDLQSQVSSLQTQLAEAQALAQLRANIITYKNNYIHTLQDILDNNGIPYPPETIYPTS